jgi:hypothetical protein
MPPPAPLAAASTNSPKILIAHRVIFLFDAVGLCVIPASPPSHKPGIGSAFVDERWHGSVDLLPLKGPARIHMVLAKVLAFGYSVLHHWHPLFAHPR